jgi:hypothetical protein
MLCHYAECHVLFTIMLSVFLLSAVMLNVVVLSIVAPETTQSEAPFRVGSWPYRQTLAEAGKACQGLTI